MRLVKPSVEIEEIDGVAALKKLELAGRTCYRSEHVITKTSCFGFIAGVIKSGHLSVIEHVSVTARVVCDRGVSHEIVRHRIGSYSQESTRYCCFKNDRFKGEIACIPMMQGLTKQQKERRIELYELAERVYLEEIHAGVRAQQARDNLPTCLRTEIVITYNLREWRHFFEMRCAPAAHPQMREIAFLLLGKMAEAIPVVFDDIYARLTDSTRKVSGNQIDEFRKQP
jgi:thymidylate synthase (FAD)